MDNPDSCSIDAEAQPQILRFPFNGSCIIVTTNYLNEIKNLRETEPD